AIRTSFPTRLSSDLLTLHITITSAACINCVSCDRLYPLSSRKCILLSVICENFSTVSLANCGSLTSRSKLLQNKITKSDGPQPFSILTISRKFKLMLRSEEHTSELQSRENLVCRL